MRKRNWILTTAFAVVTLLGAQSASAVALLGEVSGVDPGNVMPGDTLQIVAFLDPEAMSNEISLFEGRFNVNGGTLTSVNVLFGLDGLTSFITQMGERLLSSLTFSNTALPVDLLRFNITAGDPGSLEIALLSNEADLFAQKDTPTGVDDVFRSSGPASLLTLVDVEGQVIGTSLAIVPEPGTVFLLGLGLTSLAFYGRRRRTE